MARNPSALPTDAELDILRILWEGGPMELAAIRMALNEARPVATTTVATMLRIMIEKGLVSRVQGPAAFLYSARMTRKQAGKGALGKILDRIFDGSTHRMIAHLLDERPLSKGEFQEIKKLLDEHARSSPLPKGSQRELPIRPENAAALSKPEKERRK